MAKLVVRRDQQAEIRRLHPRPAYSRVVGFWLSLPADALWYYATTPPLGQNVWLMRVTVRHCPRPIATTNYSLFEVMAGKEKAETIGDIAQWQRVLPHVTDGGPHYVQKIGDGCNQYTEEMLQLFTGTARRFGIIASRVGTGEDQLYVTFQISEG